MVKELIDTQFYQAWERTFTTITPFPHLRETLEQVKSEGFASFSSPTFPSPRSRRRSGSPILSMTHSPVKRAATSNRV